ncbi:MAG: DUF4417 domain-containing protein, partial [Lachnospiraceae bacterium]|nr:DUF4417 domain-containing protein [Lachnospiraceae bacterium]
MKKSIDNLILNEKSDANIRPGCKDIWNAFMVDGASFGKYDIPFCPCTTTDIPKDQITWDEAKTLHRKHISKKERDYFVDVYINWYIDDYKFDSYHGIWHNYNSALNIIRHFAGVITPDFSTYQDFPYPFKSRTARLARRIRSALADRFPFRIRAHPRGAFISVGDWTPTELGL